MRAESEPQPDDIVVHHTGNRAARRAIKKATGAVISRRVVVTGAAISEAVSKGIAPVDLLMHFVSEALEAVVAQGGDVLKHAVVTIGEHPSFPGDLTIEAKTDLVTSTPLELVTKHPRRTLWARLVAWLRR